MKKGQLFTLLISLIILIAGCSKEKTEIPIPLKPQPKLYIRGVFGNDSLEFLHYTEGINNYYEYDDSPRSNGFILVMHEKSEIFHSRFVQIEVWTIDKDTLGTPWDNEGFSSPMPYVNLSLIDQGKMDVEFAINDSINYTGSTLINDPIYLKINAITGDTIEGIFHGDIKTRTGLLKHVTDGEFRVKFHTTLF